MVKGELIVNPCLKKTDIRFNGKEPGVNSGAEKFLKGTMQSRLQELPALFYHELNGYDFDLLFSGTMLDYRDLMEAFRSQGISDQQVRIFHQGVMESRQEKSQRIEALLQWFFKNPCPLFDPAAFVEKNRDVFDAEITCYLIGSDWKEDLTASFMGKRISFECIPDFENLRNVNLHHIPLILSASVSGRDQVYLWIQALLQRPDVSQNQLFFVFEPENRRNHSLLKGMKRGIEDLGIEKLQTMESLDNPMLEHYLEVYPITDQLNESIRILDASYEEIREILEERNRIAAEKNREAYDRLEAVEKKISKEKELLYWLESLETIRLANSTAITQCGDEFCSKVTEWQKRKNKVTGEKNGEDSAEDLQRTLRYAYRQYQEEFSAALQARVHELADTIQARAEEDHLNSTGINSRESVPFIFPVMNEIRHDLLMQFEIQEIQPKDDVFSMLLRGGQQGQKTQQLVYSLVRWREQALHMVQQLVITCEKTALEILRNTQEKCQTMTRTAIEKTRTELYEEKKNLENSLSSDEKDLRRLNDWLTEFEDEMIRIREERYE